MAMNYNFQEMRRFLEDVSFILQSGGNPLLAAQLASNSDTSQKIINAIKLFFISLGIFILLYVVYRIITGGYPRILVNLLTMSFYHKEDETQLIKENDVFFTNIDQLGTLTTKYECGNPYELFDSMYKTKTLDNIGYQTKAIQDSIELYYSGLKYEKYNVKYRYREKYINAFREYFIFYKSLIDDTKEKKKDVKKYTFSPKTDDHYVTFQIDNNKFYNLLITYLIKHGAINPKNPSKEGDMSQIELMYNMHLSEKLAAQKGDPTMYEVRYDMKKEIQKLAQNLKVAMRKINELPYHHYLLVPNSELNSKAVIADISLVDKQLPDGSVFQKRKSKELNEYSWYIIEVFNFVRNMKKQTNPWSSIVSKLKNLKSYDKNLITLYLNLPKEKKPKAETRLLSSFDKNLLETIQKYPIASKIYYSNIKANKEALYNGVMKLYVKLMSPSCDPAPFEGKNIEALMKNLSYYSKPYKQLITSTIVSDLYLNAYHDEMTRIFSMRYFNTESFFKELWVPYFDDFFHNRIKSYWKSIANKKHFKGELFARFKTEWDKLGHKLEEMTKHIWGAFKVEDKTKQPDPPEPEPDYNANSYDKSVSDSQTVTEAAASDQQKEIKADMESNKRQQADAQQNVSASQDKAAKAQKDAEANKEKTENNKN